MRELGEFLGWFTVVFFSLSFLNPVVKYVQKTFGKTLLKKRNPEKTLADVHEVHCEKP